MMKIVTKVNDGRNHMRFYKDKEKRVLEKVLCNCCGRTLAMNRKQVAEGVLHVCKDWGFFSEKDMVRHEFDMCEKCYDKMTGEFQIPVTEREILEV
jgi:hypothetical protein